MELCATPKNSQLIYDVGMHTGEDTEFFLKKGFRVIAFEADADLARSCERKFHEFIADGRLIIIRGAIVDRDTIKSGAEFITFYKNDDVSVWGTIHSVWADRNRVHQTTSTEVQVPVVDFAAILRQHGIPYYLKIDIEGADMICVEALREFQIKPDYLSIESDKTSYSAIRRELRVLSELGYTLFQAIEQSELYRVQVPPKPSREGQYADHTFPDGASGLFGRELPDRWLSFRQISIRYAVIRLGYFLVGEQGILPKRYFPGKWKLRALICRTLSLFTKAAVPGWYDTHARHSNAAVGGDTVK